ARDLARLQAAMVSAWALRSFGQRCRDGAECPASRRLRRGRFANRAGAIGSGATIRRLEREHTVAKHRQETQENVKSKAGETRRSQAADDDTTITALGLKEAAPTDAMAAYFKKCEEKLGFVPNVLKSYAFDMAKLEAFVVMYNDLMLAPSGLSKLEREMIAVA